LSLWNEKSPARSYLEKKKLQFYGSRGNLEGKYPSYPSNEIGKIVEKDGKVQDTSMDLRTGKRCFIPDAGRE